MVLYNYLVTESGGLTCFSHRMNHSALQQYASRMLLPELVFLLCPKDYVVKYVRLHFPLNHPESLRYYLLLHYIFPVVMFC